MIDRILSYIAPHLCCGCGKTGTILCDNCKYDIVIDKSLRCISCGVPLLSLGVCNRCVVPYARAWCVGERSGVLQRVIGGFKFQNVYAAYKPLADLLLDTLDELPAETVVVPVPTTAGHIRERGYDHTALLARRVAKIRQLTSRSVLCRVTTTKQRDASRAQRIAQAKKAFAVRGYIDTTVPYLLIDDVVTTGATIHYAAKALRDAGAREVWVAVIARQPLD